MEQRTVVRRLLAAQGVTGLGDGLWFTIWAIFFTRIQGISPSGMGVAISVGSIIGLLAATPAGVAADRLGPRGVLAGLIVVRAVAMASYVFVTNVWTLLLVTTVFAAAQSSAAGVRVTLVYGLMPASDQLPVLAKSRVVQHISNALGAGAAAVVLSVGTPAIFVGALLANAVTFVATAGLTMLVPRVPPVPADRRMASTQAIRDLPYLAIMTSTAMLALCWAMLFSGLPLWIAGSTTAPLWTAAVAVIISSAAIALFQVRVTRHSTSIPSAVRATRISAAALALCCVVFAMATWPDAPAVAVAVIVCGVGVHVLGELYYVSARWGLSLGLMARDAQGQYQGVTATTEAVAVALGPAVVTTLITDLHSAGWLILGALLLVAAAPTAALSRRAIHSGNRVAVATSEPAR